MVAIVFYTFISNLMSFLQLFLLLLFLFQYIDIYRLFFLNAKGKLM